MIGHRGKRLCALLLALGLVPLGTAAVRTAPMEETVPVEITAPSAMLVEAETGTVIFEKNADEQRPVASVTKLMTLLLTFEALEEGTVSLEDQVTVSRAAAGQIGSQALLDAGAVYSLKELLKSTIIASANDSAYALAEYLAGTETDFVARMNERAQELGMANTHFVNCTGLDDGPDANEHLTTARDIAIMSRELLKHEKIKEYTTIWMDTVRNGEFGLSNTNKLVRFYDGTTGLKTGYTSGAGYCLSASAERGGMELIAVVMHCKTSPDRFESAKALLNYGFANYALVDPMENLTIEPVPVVLGRQELVQVQAQGAGTILIDKALAGSVTCAVELDESVTAPVLKGQQLGTLRVEAGGRLLREIALAAAQEVPALGFPDIWRMMLERVCMAG